MNSEDNTINNDTNDRAGMPLGFWLRTVDALISREFAAAFEGTGASRRDWMILNTIDGSVSAPGFAERLARKGKRLRKLADRGWIDEQGDGTWVLTDDGRAAKERLGDIVTGIRSRVAGAVSPDDYATMTASLETIARELGWEEGMRMPRRPRRGGFGRGGRRFEPGFRHGGRDFGPDFGFRPRFGDDDRGYGRGYGHRRHSFGHGEHGYGHGAEEFEHGHGRGRHGFGHGRHGLGHGEHAHGSDRRGHGHRHDDRRAQRAYERGFDAGFTRGRETDAA